MSIYLASYDIGSNRRRRQVATLLLSYGHRIQESVFELWLDRDEMGELRARVGMLLDRSDSFELTPVDDRGPRRRYRWQRDIEPWAPVLLR